MYRIKVSEYQEFKEKQKNTSSEDDGYESVP